MITDDMMSGKRLPEADSLSKKDPPNYEETPDLDEFLEEDGESQDDQPRMPPRSGRDPDLSSHQNESLEDAEARSTLSVGPLPVAAPRAKTPHEYEAMEISRRTHGRINKVQQKFKMEDHLAEYDIDKLFYETFDGTFTHLDRIPEEAKADNFTLNKVNELLQPKIKRKKTKEKESEQMETSSTKHAGKKLILSALQKQGGLQMPKVNGLNKVDDADVIIGKKLPSLKKVEAELGIGYKDFFETLFQTMGATGGPAHEPGKISSHDPKFDNLTWLEAAKNQAVKQGDWARFEHMQKVLKEKDVTLKDIMDSGMYQKLQELEDGPEEEEVNALIEDVWVDFSNEMKDSEAKISNIMKDEVNDRLLQYLKQNSEFISGSVERHVKMINENQSVSLEDRIGNLNVIAFER